jgi:hypothetical protein
MRGVFEKVDNPAVPMRRDVLLPHCFLPFEYAKIGDVRTQRVLGFVTAMLVPLVAIGQTAPPAQPFQRLDGCVYKSQRWNDGDSFHVLLRDQKEVVF